jgi:hypothetical protein
MTKNERMAGMATALLVAPLLDEVRAASAAHSRLKAAYHAKVDSLYEEVLAKMEADEDGVK